MARRGSVWLATLAVLAMAGTLPAAADGDVTSARRLYLLASDAGFRYWGIDPTDPELDSGPIIDTFGPSVGATTERFVQQTFAPASVFAGTVPFGPDAPLRFRVELDVLAAGPFAVKLVLQKAGKEGIASEPAVEIAPGVFEGTLAQTGSLGGGPLDMFVVRVTSMSPVHRMELRTGGASWIELPQPVPAYSVPQLIARSPRPAVPITYSSATRSVAFNDDAWAVRSFSGTLDAVRTFTVEDPRTATAVLAWIDMPDTPPLSEPLHGRVPDPGAATAGPTLVLLHGADSLDVGTRSVTAVAVPAGQLGVRVQRTAASQAVPYTVHLLSVYGQRTLQQMRWRFPMTGATAFTAMGGTCGGYQGLPVTSAVTTFALDVDAASANPTSADGWTLMYELPGVGEAPCGQSNHGDEVRITAPGNPRYWRIGAAPQRRNLPVIAAADTMLELEVRFAHAPVPG